LPLLFDWDDELEVVCVEFPLFRIGATIAFGFSLVERLMLSRRSSKVLTPAAPVLDRRIEVVLDGDEEGLFSSFFSLVGEDLSLLVLLL
jgi:hypothetical protein